MYSVGRELNPQSNQVLVGAKTQNSVLVLPLEVSKTNILIWRMIKNLEELKLLSSS